MKFMRLPVLPRHIGSKRFSRNLLICIISGFSSGLPFFFLISLLPVWLKSQNVPLTLIGLTSLLQLPYALKVLWAPLLDRYPVSNRGRRRRWMLLCIGALIPCMSAMGFTSAHHPGWILASGLALSVLSATLDIALDALRREILSDQELGLGSSLHVNAYKIAGIIPGALALILSDHLPWPMVFSICSLFLLPGLLLAYRLREPPSAQPPASLRHSLLLPWTDFLQRLGKNQTFLLLLFIMLYKLGDGLASSLATPFYLEAGFSRTSIGLIAKQAGLLASIAGSILGGLLMLRVSIAQALLGFGVVQSFSILAFYQLSLLVHPGLVDLGTAIAAEAFGVGLGTTALVACIAQQTNRQFTASQFALLTSAAALPRTLINTGSGWLVHQLGWSHFFILCWLLSLPALLLIRYLPVPAEQPS